MAGDPDFTISRDSYSELKTSENRRLSAICSTTELGNNIEKSLEISGTTQYVRDNPFWNNIDETILGNLIETAINVVGGFTIGQIRVCTWFGNVLAEIGDKISFEKEDGSVVVSYLLDDSIKYDGFIEENTIWEFSENETETESNPTSLGEVLNQTFARVDKTNREITLLTSKVSENESQLASLTITTTDINTKVEEVKQDLFNTINNTNDEMSKLRTEVNQSSSDLRILIQEVDAKDVTEVKTSTGFTFDEFGLKIDKSDSEMTTQITEDGMTVSRQGNVTLTANNKGVEAENLHATTWLIIGGNSRFEDYDGPNGERRTGCYWIGV